MTMASRSGIWYSPRRHAYHRDQEEMIYRAGNTVTSLGVVMHGSVMIVNDDLWGNRSILDRVEPGQIFAETYACVPGGKSCWSMCLQRR
mgnify:CR=1 FL=1